MFSLHLLGGLTLRGSNGHPLGRAAQRKRLALLAVLARAPRRTATRDRLVGLLWSECTDEEARHRLSSALYDLRQRLGPDALASHGDDVSLDPSKLTIDTDQFESAVIGKRWSEALALYPGPFLDGVHLDDAEEFEHWMDGERDRLARLRQRAFESTGDPVAFLPAESTFSPLVSPPQPEVVPAKRRRSHWPLTAAAALGVTTLVLGWGILRRPVPTGPPGTIRIAVFPFRVLGNPPVPNLSHGVVDLLSLDLDGAGDLRVVDPDALLAGLSENSELSPDAARRRASQLGATHYILGTLQADSNRLRLRATLHSVGSAEPQALVSADGAANHLLDLVDQLSAALLADRLHDSKDRITKVGAVSTTSLPALKSWLSGESAFRRGLYTEAAEKFERATTLDSSFALAHYRHSLATLWGDRPGASTELHDAFALRHAARLTPHDRELLHAYAAWRQGDPVKAEYLYRRVLATWPDDLEAWHQLGETLFHYNPLRGRPVSESRSPFERVLALDPDHRGTRWHLALLDGLAGRTAELRRELTQLAAYPEQSPESAIELRGLLVAARGETAPLAEDPAVHSADETALASLTWRLAVFLGDLAAAERTARLLVAPHRNDYAKLIGRTLLAQLALARGRLRAAAAEVALAPYAGAGFDGPLLQAGLWTHWWAAPPKELLSRARDTLRQDDPRFAEWHRLARVFTAAQLDLALGNTDAVQHAQAQLDADDRDTTLAREFALTLRAYHAARSGNPEEALRRLDELGPPGWFGLLVSGSPRGDPLLRFVRAEALHALGRDDEAFGWYGSFGEHSLRDLAYLAPALFRRGEILERRGDAEGAHKAFTRVVALWANADPELQSWVASARAHLGARLAQATALPAGSPSVPAR